MSVRRGSLGVCLVVVVSLAGVFSSGAVALAGTGYALLAAFDGGQAVGAGAYPSGVAVDDSTSSSDPSAGDVYVTDGEVVNRFTAAHAAAGSSTPDGQLTGFAFAVSVAVDPATGEVYVGDLGGGVRKFTPQGVEEPFVLSGIALANSPRALALSPTTGDLYIGEGNGTYAVDEFTPAGAYTGRQYLSSREIGSPEGLAVDAGGNIYAALGGSGTLKLPAVCASPCTEAQPFDSADSTGVAIDPATGDVFIAQGGSLAELEPSGETVGEPFASEQLSGGGSQGIALNHDGSVLYTDDLQSDTAYAFTAGATPEEPVTAEPPTGVTATTATLQGTLGGGETAFHFTYNLGAECAGGSATESTAATGKGVRVSSEIVGLEPSSKYAFCLISTNRFGEAEGAGSFETAPSAPTIDSEHAANLKPTTATLEAQINPNNQPTTCIRFEYGTSTAYGTSTPCEVTALGQGYGDQRATARITGLAPATIYHFRVIAGNATSPPGGTDGTDAEFKTQQPAPQVTTGAAEVTSQSAAALTGTVNPQQLTTTYYYQYGPSSEYGATTSPLPAGAGGGEVTTSAVLGDLVPGTTYHYRLLAINEDGTSYGADRQFTTLSFPAPGVLTGAATVLSANTASISGTVNPQGTPTTYELQIGTDTNYGAQVFANAGEGSENELENLTLTSLQPNTTYHYRICATNIANPSAPACGADATFTTPNIPLALTQPIAPPLLATPPIAFPKPPTKAPTTKALTRAQKLAKALQGCRRKPRGKRAGCETQARRKYGAVRKGKKT